MEALAACFYICRHEDWAHEVLAPFSYGEPFLEINSQLLKRYAACTSEEEVKKAEEVWLEKIEREYAESRAEGNGADKEDAWKGGNVNRRPVIDSDEEDDSGSGGEEHDEGEEGEEEEDGGVEVDRDPLDLSDESDDAEEMAELRRRVLQSKPFTNPSADSKPQPQKISRPDPLPTDSDAESGSDVSDNEAFDNIINATLVTDRTGIEAKQRLKRAEASSAVFSRNIVSAPKK